MSGRCGVRLTAADMARGLPGGEADNNPFRLSGEAVDRAGMREEEEVGEEDMSEWPSWRRERGDKSALFLGELEGVEESTFE